MGPFGGRRQDFGVDLRMCCKKIEPHTFPVRNDVRHKYPAGGPPAFLFPQGNASQRSRILFLSCPNMASIPKTMRSLVAPKYCEPAEYEVVEMPVPEIKEPTGVLIKVHAAGIMTGDTQIAGGAFRIFDTPR